MRKILFFLVLASMLISCDKEAETVIVTYRASDGPVISEVSYRDAGGELRNLQLNFASAEDSWTSSIKFKRGDIVYLSAVYYDSIASVKLEILIDGKVYKSNRSVNEPEKYVIVSGSIPY